MDKLQGKKVDSSVDLLQQWKTEEEQKVVEYEQQRLAAQQQAAQFNANQPQLLDCIRLFTQQETLSQTDPWYCGKCKEFRRATKKLDIWKLPEILIVHLKRFHHGTYTSQKISKLVKFPIHSLDLSAFVPLDSHASEANAAEHKSPGSSTAVYDLYAVSNHMGDLGGGHYTAYAKNKQSGRWYEFDDSRCTALHDENEIVSKSAYVLFYHRTSRH
eukprot:TRINITY_DN1948_c0_g1_i9.p1 TRINITY_DN1948_c0_g1~~TRINITY_DN1948_c0_g1_i9.p1  ORF type:complete len:215 (-),score=32.99 TRINITY_DN1948_c0_g1_i9:184-828(-)